MKTETGMKYSYKQEMALADQMLTPDIMIYPENYVMFAFPWGVKGSPLANKTGPREWQREELRKIGRHNLENQYRINNGEDPIPYNLAIASGRGVGKSALISWLTLWAMSTSIGCTVIITANTESQLFSKTWPELGKWHTLAINGHWFKRTATSLRPEPWLGVVKTGIDTAYYYAQGQLWSEENPDAFAGAHNENGIALFFDEASGIPGSIWTVCKGFFTEPIYLRLWVVFSNPRRNQGAFYDCFHKKKKFWNTRNIDARTVEGTDKSIYNKIIEEDGEDSDEAKVEVRGMFPERGTNQLIGYDVVQAAYNRYIKPEDVQGSAKVIGVDVAREGRSKTVICKRQGLLLVELIELKIPDNMAVADIIAHHILSWEADACMIDRGEGAGVIDRLVQIGHNALPVYSGGSANNTEKFLNKRVEMWYEMLKWLNAGGVIPQDKQLISDLSAPTFKFTPITNKMVLESVEDMEERGEVSPDHGSALAFTFAYEIAPTMGGRAHAMPKIDDQWDPFEIKLPQ